MNFEILLSILGSSSITALLTFFFTRNKLKAETNKTNAEAHSEQIDATIKVSALLEKMQSENVDLYKQNTELEKLKTDQIRSIENLTSRLETRDKQLEATTKQLEMLRKLAEQTPITETLRTQLEAMNQIVVTLQSAQTEGQRIVLEKDKLIQSLFETNRDFALQKPQKTERIES